MSVPQTFILESTPVSKSNSNKKLELELKLVLNESKIQQKIKKFEYIETTLKHHIEMTK